MDYGENIVKDGKEYRRYKLQTNKGADNETLKQLADKDSHQVWSTADIPVGEGRPADIVEKLFEDLEAGEEDDQPRQETVEQIVVGSIVWLAGLILQRCWRLISNQRTFRPCFDYFD